METTKTVNNDTYWVGIYLSGPIDVIKQSCRQFCLQEGLCVTVDPTCFIYTGGEEFGAVVRLIAYPRFPRLKIDIYDQAVRLGVQLMNDAAQHSVLLQTPTRTTWITRRPNEL